MNDLERLLLSADRDGEPLLWAARGDGRLVGSTPQALGVPANAAFQGQAGPLMLRAATAGRSAVGTAANLRPDRL